MKFSQKQVLFALFSIPCLLLGSPPIQIQSTFCLENTQKICHELFPKGKNSVIVDIKQIKIDGYPNAFNPSIIKTEKGILLIFRNQPFSKEPFISETGYVWLNDALEPMTSPKLISTRKPGDPTPQQSEDFRIFSLSNELYLIYNDNVETTNPPDRRDMFIAKLTDSNGTLVAETPKKIIHREKHESVKMQKNWQPFDWEGILLVAYSIDPHEILLPDLDSGICTPAFETTGETEWHWGKLRGGAPAHRFDDHYLAFFHSPIPIVSETTGGRQLMHYFMGAYTFSAEPPFNLTSISPYPIFTDNFFSASPLGIRCIYPGGFFVQGDYVYLACGKDDHEVWIVVIDKNKLYQTLRPIKQTYPDE